MILAAHACTSLLIRDSAPASMKFLLALTSYLMVNLETGAFSIFASMGYQLTVVARSTMLFVMRQNIVWISLPLRWLRNASRLEGLNFSNVISTASVKAALTVPVSPLLIVSAESLTF